MNESNQTSNPQCAADHELLERDANARLFQSLREANMRLTARVAELESAKANLMQGYKNFVDDAAEREGRLRAALEQIDGQILLDKYEYRRIAARALGRATDETSA